MKTLKKFAKDNGVSIRTAYREIQCGALEAVKVRNNTMIRPEAETTQPDVRALLPIR